MPVFAPVFVPVFAPLFAPIPDAPPVLSRLLNRLIPGRDPRDTQPLPVLAAPVAVIGDIHGRADLLEMLLGRLEAHRDAATMRVICVGDMLDRGPESLRVLEMLHALTTTPAPFAQMICLKGNHEQMMLDFLDDPLTYGPRWLANGGTNTLENAGLETFRRSNGDDAQTRLTALRDGYLTALGPGRTAWLRALPVQWREGDLAVTHAAMMPGRPPETQPEDVLLWGHPAFLRQARRDGIWVAHGHTIVETPVAAQNRISVDTGAWRTGRLTAAVITNGEVTFETT